MNFSDFTFQLLLLLPISLVSATAVALFVPRAGAVEIAEDQIAADVSGAQINAGAELYVERIVQSQWEKQRRWSLVKKIRKRNIDLARVSKLGFVAVGAVAQVAATQVPEAYKTTVSFLGGACVGIGAYIKTNYLTSESVSDMVTSFYIAQSLKSEVMRFRSKAAPYNGNRNAALDTLRVACGQISRNGDDHKFHTMHKDAKPVPKPMHTKDDYIQNRLDVVINNLYVKEGLKLKKRGKLCSRIEDLLLYTGTVAGLGATQQLPAYLEKVFSSVTSWAGALTTVSAAFANHEAKTKYDEISEQYFDAADGLRELKDAWPLNVNKAGDPGWDDQINDCEDVILSTVELFAKTKTGNKDLKFTKPKRKKRKEKKWNPNVVIGNDDIGIFKASERKKWLMDNKGLSEAEAKSSIMTDYPSNF
jgi:hypothetical protein